MWLVEWLKVHTLGSSKGFTQELCRGTVDTINMLASHYSGSASASCPFLTTLGQLSMVNFWAYCQLPSLLAHCLLAFIFSQDKCHFGLQGPGLLTKRQRKGLMPSC